MNEPLVSVLTPCYNQRTWLADNLRSVANQTYPRIEHIIRDDGSTDDSIEVLREHAGQAARWSTQSNRGQSNALNMAFRQSSGEIIGWLNSDDAYFDRTAVSAAVEAFQRYPKVDVVYGHAAVVNARGLVLQVIWVPPFHPRLLRLHNFIIQPAAFIRRSALGDFIANEAYDYSMDRELWLRLSRQCQFRRIKHILGIDRHHGARKGVARPDLVQADRVRLRAEYGVAFGNAQRFQLKVLKVAFRMLGLGLARRCYISSLAFDGERDAIGKLVLRQTMVRRASMPGIAERSG